MGHAMKPSHEFGERKGREYGGLLVGGRRDYRGRVTRMHFGV